MVFKTFVLTTMVYHNAKFSNDGKSTIVGLSHMIDGEVEDFLRKNPNLHEVERSAPSVSITFTESPTSRRYELAVAVTSKFEEEDEEDEEDEN